MILEKTIPHPLLRATRLPGVFLLGLLLLGCLDEIDLAQGEPLPSGIVLQGRINAGNDGEPSDVEIRLERLFIAEESNRPDRVVTATVTVENSEGQSVPLRYADDAYVVEIPANDPDFRVAPGLGYRARAITREGEEYLTEFDVLPPPLEVDEAGATLATTEVLNTIGNPITVPAMRFDVSAPVRYPDGSPTFLRWTLERTYKVTDLPGILPFLNNDPKSCYVSRALDGDDLKLFSSLTSTADRVEDLVLTFDPVDYEYSEGYVMTIFQEALSQEAFEYFDQIDRIGSRESSLFEPPAGPVVGNAFDVAGESSNVFGFFYATNRTLGRVAVSPEEAGNPAFFCPLSRPPSPFPSANDCDDCLRINNSVLQRPSWFPF